MILFEKLEDFINLLKKVEDKNIPIYVLQRSGVNDQTLMLSGNILMQFHYNGDSVSHTYTDNITHTQMISTISLMSLKKVLDEETMKQVNEGIQKNIEKFNNEMKAEYDKAIAVFKKMGFENIVNAQII
jgi:hypothetical protein